jgi:hypothetical protein
MSKAKLNKPIAPIAILCADIHLSEFPPVARSAEPDWLAAQQRNLDEVRDLARSYGNIPIICAGDVFDRWNSSAAIINWALDHLPPMYAVHGQHDLPMHNQSDIRRSAYWTLVRAGVVTQIEPSYRIPDGDMVLFGVPYGVDIKPIEKSGSAIHVGVIHSFVWQKGYSYIGAPADRHVSRRADSLRGYDVAVFGDNHQGFVVQCGDTTVCNCGCTIPRKSTEQFQQPCVGVLYSNGEVKRHALDTSQDKWIDESHSVVVGIEKDQEEMIRFVDGLRDVHSNAVDFKTAVIRYLDKHPTRPEVKKLVQRIMEENNERQ